MATRKTILSLEVNNKEWHLQYSGSVEPTDDKAAFKHDARIMDALMSDDKLLDLFYRLVTPVVRYKRREARREARLKVGQK